MGELTVRELSRFERGVLWGALWVSLAVAAAAVVGTGVQVFELWRGNVTGTVPLVNSYFPKFAEESPLVVSGQYDTASLTVEDAPAGVRALLTAAAVIRCAAAVAVCGAAAVLCRGLLGGRTFVRAVWLSLAASGVAVLLAAVIPGMLEVMATSQLVSTLGLPAVGQSGTAEGIGLAGPPIEFPGLAVGFLLVLVASAFQMAERSRRAAAAPA